MNFLYQDIEAIKKKISGDFLTFELDENLAIVKCVFCPKTFTVFLRPTSNNDYLWKTSNFDRHLKIIHRYDDIDSHESDNDNDLKSKDHGELKKKLSDLDSDLDRAEDSEQKGDLNVSDVPKDLCKENDFQSKFYGQQTVTLSVLGKEKDSEMKIEGEQTKTLSDTGKKLQKFTEPCNEKPPETKGIGQLDSKLAKNALREFSNCVQDCVPILKNGHKSRHGREFIITTHTCAFDTIMNSFATMYLQSSHVREQIDSNGSQVSELIKSLFSCARHCSDFKEPYAHRNTILKELYSGWCRISNIRKHHDTTYIDCTTGIGGLFGRICLKFDENFVSAAEERNCRKCGTVHTKLLPFLKTTEKVRNLAKIDDYVDRSLPEKLCPTCKNKCEFATRFNNIVVLETEPVTMKRNKRNALENVCPTLHVDNTPYRLCAVMHFDVELNHFVAYTRQNDNSWNLLDDLKKTEQKADASTEINPFLVCYLATIRRIDFENLIESKVNKIENFEVSFYKKFFLEVSPWSCRKSKQQSPPNKSRAR